MNNRILKEIDLSKFISIYLVPSHLNKSSKLIESSDTAFLGEQLFTVSLEEFQERLIVLKFVFNDPLYISTGQNLD